MRTCFWMTVRSHPTADKLNSVCFFFPRRWGSAGEAADWFGVSGVGRPWRVDSSFSSLSLWHLAMPTSSPASAWSPASRETDVTSDRTSSWSWLMTRTWSWVSQIQVLTVTIRLLRIRWSRGCDSSPHSYFSIWPYKSMSTHTSCSSGNIQPVFSLAWSKTCFIPNLVPFIVMIKKHYYTFQVFSLENKWMNDITHYSSFLSVLLN